MVSGEFTELYRSSAIRSVQLIFVCSHKFLNQIDSTEPELPKQRSAILAVKIYLVEFFNDKQLSVSRYYEDCVAALKA